MSKKAKFEVGNLVCHKEQGMGIGQIKQVLRDHAYKVDFGPQGVFKLHESVLEGVSEIKASEPEFEAVEIELSPAERTLLANDPVNHPSHYCQGGIECIEALKAATTELEGIEAVCTANAIKYLWRWKRKNGAQDLEKAKFYIDYLIKHLKGENKQ